MQAATKKVIMFVHLWKIFCEQRSVFSILREEGSGKNSHFYLFFFFFSSFNPDCWKAEREAQESSGKIHCRQGSLCSSSWTCGLNHLTIRAQCVSLTSCTRKKKTYMQDTKRMTMIWLLSRQAVLSEIQQNSKEESSYSSPQITRINGWIVSQAQTDRFERERDHVWWQLVPSCDAPLADRWDLGVLVGRLSLLGHAWLDNGQRHSHTPLWGS